VSVLPITASEGGQGQYSVSILEGWLGSGGWAAGNFDDSMIKSSMCLECGTADETSTSIQIHIHILNMLKKIIYSESDIRAEQIFHTLFIYRRLLEHVASVVWKKKLWLFSFSL